MHDTGLEPELAPAELDLHLGHASLQREVFRLDSRALKDSPTSRRAIRSRHRSDKRGVTGIARLGYFIGPTPKTSFVRPTIRSAESRRRTTRECWYAPRLTSFKPVYNVRWPPWIAELDPPERFRNIAHGLTKRGYTTEQIEKILGGNWIRYFTEVLG